MPGVSHVFKIKEMKPVDGGAGRRSWLLVSGDKGSQFLTTGITEFQPGSGLELHTHNCEEQVTVLEGEALAEIDGVTHELTAPDTTFVTLGLPHRFVNRGNKPMKILWVYTTTKVTRTFVGTGQTANY